MKSIFELHSAYEKGLSPKEYLLECLQKAQAENENNIWISLLAPEVLDFYLKKLPSQPTPEFPLYGVPFAIKDNIDLAGVPTTAACPGFSYKPTKCAFVVKQLIKAGAIPLGKTNMDQFATGLVGTRSPYGQCKNSIDPNYISGGSSSGSAVAVAKKHVLFSLGTDTAGSGRVPAALNNLWGLKPSRGLLSCTGVVPACKSLDCVSIFAKNPEDLNRILPIAKEYDVEDVYSNSKPLLVPRGDALKIGIPRRDELQFFGNAFYKKAFDDFRSSIKNSHFEIVEIDYSCFKNSAELLYGGPWVAERYVAMENYLKTNPTDLDPAVAGIVKAAENLSARDAFRAFYQLEKFKNQSKAIFKEINVLLTPTIGTLFTREEIDQDPINANTKLGYYTNHMNLLNLCGLAFPAGQIPHPNKPDASLPFGVTLHAPWGHDLQLINLAQKLTTHLGEIK